MEHLNNNKILIAPFSPLTQKLSEYLKRDENIKFIGFIDSNKIGDNIYKKEDIKNLDFEKLLIFSPNHFLPIYKTLKSYTASNNIYKVDFIDNQYYFFSKKEILKQNMQDNILKKYTKLKKIFLRNLSLTLDNLQIKRELSVFISEDYVDANIKHLFLYYIKNNKKAILLTNNSKQQQEFQKYNLPTAELFSWQGYFYTALAKNIYLDHFILDYLEYLSETQTTIQLWHGVGLKPIQDRSNIHYNYFISTSDWTNETNFKKVFKADNFLNLGYPRNDILLKKTEDKLDLILCDMDIYEDIQDAIKNDIKTILYMPTFRENGFESFPLNFSTLNENMKEVNAKFYVKLHPYVLHQYRESIKEQKFSNIIFYNTQGDIYPILKYIDILVTDYSSIAYDFLLLDRPIIFFNYDYDEYISIRGNKNNNQFLFDYYDYTPGNKVKTQNQLVDEIQLLLKEKNIPNIRNNIRNIFFDTINVPSCSFIEKEIG